MPDPKKNTAFTFAVGLVDSANQPAFKATPTLAAGDFKVDIDGAGFNNLTTLPTVTPAAGRRVQVALSATEMNGDIITVQCVDATGAEWDDVLITINTSVRNVDDLAYPATSGRSLDVNTSGLVTLAGVTHTGAVIPTITDLTNLPATAALEATLTTMKGATFSGTTDSLEAIRDRGDTAWITATGFSTHSAADVWSNVTRTLTSSSDPTAATIADAIWDETLSDHTTVGTTGQKLKAVDSRGLKE